MKASAYNHAAVSLLLMAVSFIIAAVFPSRNNTVQKYNGGRLEYSSNFPGDYRVTCFPGGVDCDPSILLTNTSEPLQFTSWHWGTSADYFIHTTF